MGAEETGGNEGGPSPMETPRRAGSSIDAIDGVTPAVVISPTTTDEVVSIVKDCRSSALAIVPAGGATLLAIGNVPRRFDVRLDLLRLTQTIEHSPEDMVVTIAASVSLASLNERLAETGQRVGLTAPDPQRATVGGLAAADFPGPLAYAFGCPRDQILGMTVVDGCGRRLRVGGRVVKNVAGYDLPRLFSGSYGTLAVITELTLRTHPSPAKARTLHVECADPERLDAARGALFASNLPLSAIDADITYRAGAYRCSLGLLVEGTEAEVAQQATRIAALCASPDSESEPARPAAAARSANAPVVVRIVGRPADGIRLATDLLRDAAEHGLEGCMRVEAAGAWSRWFADCVRPEDSARAVALARRLASRYGASAIVERVPSSEKRRLDVWGERPAGFEIMQRLKARFDPDDILAPGRFVGGI